MIDKVSFAGKVMQAGNVKNISKPKEVKKIQSYADRTDCDVVLTNRTYYVDGTGVYDALLIKADKTTGGNIFARKEFNFRDDPNASVNPRAKYQSTLEDVYA